MEVNNSFAMFIAYFSWGRKSTCSLLQPKLVRNQAEPFSQISVYLIILPDIHAAMIKIQEEGLQEKTPTGDG